MGKPAKWYEKSGPEEDVVVSTHVSLSRNLSGIPEGFAPFFIP